MTWSGGCLNFDTSDFLLVNARWYTHTAYKSPADKSFIYPGFLTLISALQKNMYIGGTGQTFVASYIKDGLNLVPGRKWINSEWLYNQ